MAQANIKAVITADDRASATLGAFGNSVDNLGSKITGALKVAGVAAFVATTAAIVAATKASWDQVDAVQQATVGLKAYEKNGDKVNAVLSDLIKYARSDLGVLFNRKDLFQSAQSLKLMGDNTDDLVKHVQILSRSVGLGLSNWDDLNLVVGRIGSTGRLAGEDFDNLTKAGFKLDSGLRNTDITFSKLFENLDKGIPADALAGQADTIQGKMIRLDTAFRGVGDAILGVNSETGKFDPGSLGEKLTQAISGITEFLKKPEFKQALIDVTAGFVKMVDKIQEVLSRPEVKQGIRDTIDGVKQGFVILKDVLKQVFETMQPVFDYIKNNKEAWDVLRVALVAIVVIIVALTIAVGIGLVGAFAAVMAIINVAVAVVTGIIYAITWLGDAIAGVIWWLIQFHVAAYNTAVQFANDFRNGINTVVSFFKSLPGRILAEIGNLGNLLFGAGQSMIQGLINGIKNAAGAAADAAKGVADSAVKAAKNLLGIHSPSTVFAGIGENIGAGMVQGIESTMPSVTNAMNSLTPSNLASQPQSNGTIVTQNNPTPNITIQVGAFMGTQTDARKLAKMVFDSYQEIQAMGGVA